MIKIKPCPFCGLTPNIDDESSFRSSQGGKWGNVVCCCEGPEVRTNYKPLESWKEDAIKEWNRRD